MPYDYEQVSPDVLEKLRYAKSELDILSKGIYDPETQRKLDESMKLVNEFWGGYDKWDSLRVKEQEEQEQTELEKVIEQLVLADQENQRLRQSLNTQSPSYESPYSNSLEEMVKDIVKADSSTSLDGFDFDSTTAQPFFGTGSDEVGRLFQSTSDREKKIFQALPSVGKDFLAGVTHNPLFPSKSDPTLSIAGGAQATAKVGSVFANKKVLGAAKALQVATNTPSTTAAVQAAESLPGLVKTQGLWGSLSKLPLPLTAAYYGLKGTASMIASPIGRGQKGTSQAQAQQELDQSVNVIKSYVNQNRLNKSQARILVSRLGQGGKLMIDGSGNLFVPEVTTNIPSHLRGYTTEAHFRGLR